MNFELLDNESEKLLRKLLKEKNILNKNVEGETIENLIKKDYISGNSSKNLSDIRPKYVLTGINQKGKTYFEMKEKNIKEQKRLSQREWKIAIISAIIGGVIGLIPTIIS